MNSRMLHSALLALVAFATIGAAMAAQRLYGYHPCELCILQRIAMISLGVSLAVATVFQLTPRLRFVGHVLVFLATLCGAGIAVRQLILQAWPPSAHSTCSIALYNMLGASRYEGFWHALLYGSGDCAKVDTILGVTIPAWSLAAFVGIAALYALSQRRTMPAQRH